jgi:two-component system, chemotaxis family, chemotaxis protein CheY
MDQGEASMTMTKKRVLVVDDSVTVRQHVAATLAPAGFDVVEADDGESGAEAISNDVSIAVVLCDVNMPRMNGIEMVEKVMKDPRHAALPILMLTTEGQAALIRRAKEAGARGWIVKPFKPNQLVAAVEKLAAAR